MCKLVLIIVVVVVIVGLIYVEEIKFGLLQDFMVVYIFVIGQYNQGQCDYLMLVNEEGGIGGNIFIVIVCDIGNQFQCGIEVYNCVKEEGVILFDFLLMLVFVVILDQVQVDKNIVIIFVYGWGDVLDGMVFFYIFLVMVIYWVQVVNFVEYMKQIGGFEGKKIVIVYIDSFFGCEFGLILQVLFEQEGFEFCVFFYVSFGNE